MNWECQLWAHLCCHLNRIKALNHRAAPGNRRGGGRGGVLILCDRAALLPADLITTEGEGGSGLNEHLSLVFKIWFCDEILAALIFLVAGILVLLQRVTGQQKVSCHSVTVGAALIRLLCWSVWYVLSVQCLIYFLLLGTQVYFLMIWLTCCSCLTGLHLGELSYNPGWFDFKGRENVITGAGNKLYRTGTFTPCSAELLQKTICNLTITIAGQAVLVTQTRDLFQNVYVV